MLGGKSGFEMMLSQMLKNLGIDPEMLGGLASTLHTALTVGLADNREIIARQKRIETMLENLRENDNSDMPIPPRININEVRNGPGNGTDSDGGSINAEYRELGTGTT